MAKKPVVFSVMIIFLLISALSCNFPGDGLSTPNFEPSPDLNNATTATQTTAVALNTLTPSPSRSSPTTTSPATIALQPTDNPVLIPTQSQGQFPTPFVLTQIAPFPTPVYYPTSSFIGPDFRSTQSVKAIFFYQQPTIDGLFDEWSGEEYRINNVSIGQSDWSGDTDLSAWFRVAWDASNLYLAARVQDDHYVQQSTGLDLFKGDGLDLLIDSNVSQDYYLKAIDGDDFQLGISPGQNVPGQGPESYLWYPQYYAGPRPEVIVAAKPTNVGYDVEVSIPWYLLGVSPWGGLHVGFVFSVSDNDRMDQSIQQTLISNVSGRNLFDPTTWGDLTLVSGKPPTPIPALRAGPTIEAGYITKPPSIDGNLNDWTLDPYPISNVVYGSNYWFGTNDLSGNLLAGWDENYLYLGVQVVDDVFVQNMSGENLFKGDSLEVLFDANLVGDFYQPSLNADDFQIGISPGKPGLGISPEAYLWFPKDQAGARPQIHIASALTNGGYIIETAIPWSIFGIAPIQGKYYGFAFSISDNDVDANVQQSMVSNLSLRILTDVTTWGNLVLSKP